MLWTRPRPIAPTVAVARASGGVNQVVLLRGLGRRRRAHSPARGRACAPAEGCRAPPCFGGAVPRLGVGESGSQVRSRGRPQPPVAQRGFSSRHPHARLLANSPRSAAPRRERLRAATAGPPRPHHRPGHAPNTARADRARQPTAHARPAAPALRRTRSTGAGLPAGRAGPVACSGRGLDRDPDPHPESLGVRSRDPSVWAGTCS